MSGPRIALIGFGEVGQAIAADLHRRGLEDIAAWDKLFPVAGSIPARAVQNATSVRAGTSLHDALAGRSLVISAVTAGECVAAARESAPCLEQGAYYFDLNSVSPDTKSHAARLVEAGGGRYVEAAVMSPIQPRGSASPMLIGGRHATGFAPLARELGFLGIEVFGDTIGGASAAKMCRSVMVKGLEALLTESLLAARHYGVEPSVLSSLQNLFPAADWPSLAHYMISRSLQHGRRRAEEMREVARTVRDAGIDPWMSTACVQRQQWAATHAAALAAPGLDQVLDAVLAETARTPGEAG
jgi:3-hydroxyisobutyrate dehydrogenase-like beta-hydroxyacid dehydrogenase